MCSGSERSPLHRRSLRRGHREPCWLLGFVLTASAAVGVACTSPPPEPSPGEPPSKLMTIAAGSLPAPPPSCEDIPCAVPGAARGGHLFNKHAIPEDVPRGRVIDERGEPVHARIAVFDQPVDRAGGFLAACGTRRDGSFVFPAPAREPGNERTIVVESRGGFRNLRPDDLPSGAQHDVVLHQVRALPLSIPLLEPAGDSTRIWVVVERHDEAGSEHWAQHTLWDYGSDLGRRRVGDSVGGLVSVSDAGDRVRATVFVPVGQVRVGVTLERRPSRDAGERDEAHSAGLLFNDLDLLVVPGVDPLPERSLPVPHLAASTLEIRLRPSPGLLECWPGFTLRRAHGVRRSLVANSRRGGWALRLPSIPPGTYALGDAPDCMETFEVPASGAHEVDVRRECAVSCTPIWCGNTW